MNMILKYNDVATIVEAASDGYRGSKSMVAQYEVDVIFVQNTGFESSNFQENIDADAICWPDITNEFVLANYNRLEGMYLMISLYGSPDVISWYKITSCTVNRDHLLGNTVDNIELALKKTEPVPGVS